MVYTYPFISLVLVLFCNFGCVKTISTPDLLASQQALEFIEKWADTRKLNINIIFPTEVHTKTNDLMKFLKKLKMHVRPNVYWRFDINITDYYGVKQNQTELFWFPLEEENQEMNCNFLNYLDNQTQDSVYFIR